MLTINLMLTAQVADTDTFYREGYLAVKHEFAEWCDASRCVFAKIDKQNIVELFFDIDPPKLKAWLSKSSIQEMFKTHKIVPARYTFRPLEMG